jgi:hypothetical protein
MFKVEPFVYWRDIAEVYKFDPADIAWYELERDREQIGIETVQGVIGISLVFSENYDSLIFRDKSGKAIAYGGISKECASGIMCPWYVSDATEWETKCPHEFIGYAKMKLREWKERWPNAKFANQCLNNPKVTKFLRLLGFTVEPSEGDFTRFYMV